MRDGPEPERRLGDLLQDLVNRVSHRGGKTLAMMNDASVTLQQVLLLNRLREQDGSTSSELAETLNMSLPSISQMIDRLHQLKLVTRAEMSEDRRKKRIALTRAGRTLLERLHEARTAEYEAGLAKLLAEPQRAELRLVLDRILQELATPR
ncbi:MAG TPA: MarR family transcriptional regulator [Stellaceae bacterium]|nr:MarR family transcriptional regulator [Stellaceae bacterium]